MRFSPCLPSASRLLVAGAMTLPLVLHAQAPAPKQEPDWQRANGVVGALQRGHIDVLKWEQANLPPAVTESAPAEAIGLTVEDAVHAAWHLHPELTTPLASLGVQNRALITQGRWTSLDPSLQRRIEHADEVLAIANRTRKAWIEAVAAQQSLQNQHNLLEAAQNALALGQRMVTVGNWSKLQLAQVQLVTTNARMNLRRAQHAAERTRNNLHKAVAPMGSKDMLTLPTQLPAVPTQPLAPEELHQRAEALRQQLPLAEQRRNQTLLREAESAYRTAHALAQDSQEEILKTRELILEETVLHYNGMLKSVWDLLDEVRNQSQATMDAITAQRDFWTAEADLQWVLQGGEPDSFVTLGSTGGDSPRAAAH